MLTLSPVVRRRVLAGVVALAIFAGGIGATRIWDAVQIHQAQHAAWPTIVTAINILLAQVPAAGAAFRQVTGAVPVLPPLPTPTEAATPDEEAEADPAQDADEAAHAEETDDGSDPS